MYSNDEPPQNFIDEYRGILTIINNCLSTIYRTRVYYFKDIDKFYMKKNKVLKKISYVDDLHPEVEENIRSLIDMIRTNVRNGEINIPNNVIEHIEKLTSDPEMTKSWLSAVINPDQ
jgi:hypothetical protein